MPDGTGRSETHRLTSPKGEADRDGRHEVAGRPVASGDGTAITTLLNEAGARPEARDELLQRVYEQLRAMAGARMRQERPDHTLQPTVLVHEAFLRLVGDEQITWEERGHFFRLAAEAMRRMLIDHARRRDTLKRGGNRRAMDLGDIDPASPERDPAGLLVLDEALRALEREDPAAADVVKLRFFGGLGVAATAEALGMSERTVHRESAFARARLQELTRGEGGGGTTPSGSDADAGG